MAESFDVIVIGSGPGGYVAAIRAAQLKLKTACIEKGALGGTCLNVGCIPSKALLHSSEFYWKCAHQAKALGVNAEKLSADFSTMLLRKNQIVTSFQEGIAALFKKNQVTLFKGEASFLSPQQIRITKETGVQEIQGRHIIIATGSQPTPLAFLPFDEKRIVSSTGALALPFVPRKMVVIGAGVIGVELGSVYQRLGANVQFVEFMERICPTLDESLSKELHLQLQRQGMQFHLGSKVSSAQIHKEQIFLNLTRSDKSTQEIAADVVLVCIGRKPYCTGLGLDKVGISLTAQGSIPVDGFFRTKIPTLFAIGDIIDGPMLAHKAEEEGIAVAEIIAGYQPHVHYIAIPQVVYTHPEVASVGLTETAIKQAGLKYKTGSFAFKANSRARCTGEETGFVTLFAEENKGTLLGVHIIGAHASELIAEAALAIQQQLTVDALINTPHSHPTLSEAIKEAALNVEKRAIHR